MKRQNKGILKLVTIAFLMALVVVLQLLGGVIPPIAGFSISLVLIPIVLGAAAYGPGAGALLGATFGTIVYINCVNGLDMGGHMVFQASPILCFLVVMGKGILAGLASGFVFQLFKSKNTYLAMLLAAIVCPVVNTGVFITCMFLFFNEVLAVWAGGSDIVGYVLSGLVLINFVPELIINIAFSFPGERVYRVIHRKKS
jgi:uncharacterized membrane protein